MAKMRVRELAKELNVESKDVVDILRENGYPDIKSSNNIEGDAIDIVRRKFSSMGVPKKQSAPKPEETEAKTPQKPAQGEAPKAPTHQKQVHENQKAPAKKITAVFNAQYTRDGSQRPGGRNDRFSRVNNGRPNQSSVNRGRNGIIKPRVGNGAVSARTRTNNDPILAELKAEEAKKAAENNAAASTTAAQTNTPKQPAPQNNAGSQAQNNTAAQANAGAAKASGAGAQGSTNNAPAQNENKNAARPQAQTEKPVQRIKVRENIFANRPQQKPSENRSQQGQGRNPKSRDGRPGQGDPNRDRNQGGRKPQPDSRRNDKNIRNDMPSQPSENFSRKGHGKKKVEHDALGSNHQERFMNLEKSERKKQSKQKAPERNEDEILTITVPDHITLKELADKMMEKPADIIKKLFLKGQMVTVNTSLTFEEAEEIALEYNCILEKEEKEDVIAEMLKDDEDDEKDLVPRPPVVCVMGHVDHGKTSLLDAIRHTHVSQKEAGGITQKIGAYVVSSKGRKITFLDTPGHEAFTAMRMRGANSTDIAILVVAADDGVMPQTIEAINHAKAAGVEIIVAVNKIDKPNANIERVKQELAEYELIPEDWGGQTIFVPVSAHTHEGIDDLLEMILLTADVMELKANPNRNARGVVIEAELDKGRGAVATVLVQKGTLHVGDPVAAGSCYGKVRAMLDENGKNVKKAGPSTPVEILGLSDVPNAGEIFTAFDNEKDAHNFANTFISEEKKSLIDETRSRMSLDDLFSKIQEGSLKELDLIVKADVQGSVEAVKSSLEKLSNDEVIVKVIHGGVGAINESDVTLAAASNAIIIGFNVRPDAVAKQLSETEGVEIKLYNVIYNAIEDVQDAMKGMLEPVYEEKVIGHAEVRAIFKSSDVGNIAGSFVLDGTVERDCLVRITRGKDQIYEGKLISAKRFKDDVKEVKAGFECGLVFENFGDMQEGDQIEAYKMVEVERK